MASNPAGALSPKKVSNSSKPTPSPTKGANTNVVVPKNPFKFNRLAPTKKLELLENKSESTAISNPSEDLPNAVSRSAGEFPIGQQGFKSSSSEGYKNYYKIIFDKLLELFPDHNICKRLNAATAFNPNSADGELSCLLELASVLEKMEEGSEAKDALECSCENNGRADVGCYPWFFKTLVYADVGVALLSSIRRPVKSPNDLKIQSWALRVASRITNLRNNKRQCNANPDYLENANPFFKEKSIFFSKKPPNTYMEDCRNALLGQVVKISGEIMEALTEISIGKLTRHDDSPDRHVMILNNPIVDFDTFKFMMVLLNNRIEDAVRSKSLELMNTLLLTEANLMKVLEDKNWSEFVGLMMTKDSKRARMTISGPDEKVSPEAEERMNVIRLEMNLLAIMMCGAICYEEDDKAFRTAMENIQLKLTLESIGDISCDMLRVALFSTLKRFAISAKAMPKNEVIDFKVMFRNFRLYADSILAFAFFQSNGVGRVELHLDDDNDLPDVLLFKELAAILKVFFDIEVMNSPANRRNANKFGKALAKFKADNQDVVAAVDASLEYIQMLRQGYTSGNDELQAHCQGFAKMLVFWRQQPQKLSSTGRKGIQIKEDEVTEVFEMLLQCADQVNSNSDGPRANLSISKASSKKRIYARALFAKKLVKNNMKKMDEVKEEEAPAPPKLRQVKSAEGPPPKPAFAKSKSTPGSTRAADEKSSGDVSAPPVLASIAAVQDDEQMPSAPGGASSSPQMLPTSSTAGQEQQQPKVISSPAGRRKKSAAAGGDEGGGADHKRKHSRSKSRGGGKSVHELPEMDELGTQ
eukprot:TRINITY_DN6392_c0_g1_i3.p1 TRINITY_DN6392_c0_g1~~TRINITY_DN6392_c0_g1_i3.p1  ORF type:complete len:813 (+),score=219.94 TRINITY_DN6392_c0_g1_i3:292-2730(+)